MPKHSPHIVALAKKGAEHRLQELQAEIVELINGFPHLKTAQRKKPYPLELEQQDLPHATKRRRRGMSAAQRKSVSARMKKYWAARRKAKRV